MSYTLITGASSGIGEAFAHRFAREGHDVILAARSEEKLRSMCEDLKQKHKIDAQHIAIDLTEAGSDKVLFDETVRRGFDVEMLINNAGFGSAGDFASLDVEKETRMVVLNCAAVVGLTHRFLQPMRARRGGTIVNVSSAAGFQPIPFMATYAATKAFVSSFSEAIAEENRPYGIYVLTLCPGSTKTNFFDAGSIERPIQVKGQQTVEQVVETAMDALKKKKRKVVSGLANKVGALLGTIVPNAISSRVMGRALRARYQKEG